MTLDVTKMGLDDGKEIQKLMTRYYPLLMEQAAGDAEDRLGVDIKFDMSNPKVQDILEQLAKKVKDVADTTKQDIRDLVGQQASEGWSMDELAAAIRGRGVTDSKSRSEAIARTESASAYSKGSVLAYQESGVVQGTTWLATGDSCPICQDLDGQTADLGDLFDGEYDGPPAHVNCLVGETMVIAPYQLREATFVRWFDGEVVVIRTANNADLTCTVNHPILTTRGWIAAGLLNKGDYVIHALDAEGVASLLDPDNKHVPTRIEEIASSALMPGKVTTRTMPASPEDFHGDGRGSEIYIKGANSQLMGDFDAQVRKVVKQAEFVGAIEAAAQLATSRALDEFLFSPFLATNGVIRSLDNRFALVLVEPAVSDLYSLGVGSGDTSRLQPFTNATATGIEDTPDCVGSKLLGDVEIAQDVIIGALACGAALSHDKSLLMETPFKSSSTDADTNSELSDRLALLIAPIEIVHIERRQFTGHVYNLQTVQGWYIANNIITHNCTCAQSPIVKG